MITLIAIVSSLPCSNTSILSERDWNASSHFAALSHNNTTKQSPLCDAWKIFHVPITLIYMMYPKSPYRDFVKRHKYIKYQHIYTHICIKNPRWISEASATKIHTRIYLIQPCHFWFSSMPHYFQWLNGAAWCSLKYCDWKTYAVVHAHISIQSN